MIEKTEKKAITTSRYYTPRRYRGPFAGIRARIRSRRADRCRICSCCRTNSGMIGSRRQERSTR